MKSNFEITADKLTPANFKVAAELKIQLLLSGDKWEDGQEEPIGITTIGYCNVRPEVQEEIIEAAQKFIGLELRRLGRLKTEIR